MSKRTKYIQYKGICDTYGPNKVSLTSFVAPLAVNCAVLDAFNELSLATATGSLALTFVGMSRGYSAACDIHWQLCKQQSKQNVDFDIGSSIVRQSQLKAFTKQIGAAMLFNLIVAAPTLDFIEDQDWSNNEFDMSTFTIFPR